MLSLSKTMPRLQEWKVGLKQILQAMHTNFQINAIVLCINKPTTDGR